MVSKEHLDVDVEGRRKEVTRTGNNSESPKTIVSEEQWSETSAPENSVKGFPDESD